MTSVSFSGSLLPQCHFCSSCWSICFSHLFPLPPPILVLPLWPLLSKPETYHWKSQLKSHFALETLPNSSTQNKSSSSFRTFHSRVWSYFPSCFAPVTCLQVLCRPRQSIICTGDDCIIDIWMDFSVHQNVLWVCILWLAPYLLGGLKLNTTMAEIGKMGSQYFISGCTCVKWANLWRRSVWLWTLWNPSGCEHQDAGKSF